MSAARSLPPGSVAVVLGTRPEAIKLVELVDGLGPAAWIVHTGQHYDPVLGDDVLASVGFPDPHVRLDVGGATRGRQIGRGVAELDDLLRAQAPRAVVVQGDTNATVAAALAANACEIPVVHVEAGLRSFDRAMPEEHNRVVVDHLSDLCCAPTTTAAAHLRREGLAEERIVVTGNTVVEAVVRLLPPPSERSALRVAVAPTVAGRFVLATFHRPENVDDPATLALVLDALAALDVPVVVPLHPRTRARIEAHGLNGALAALTIVAPLPPRTFLALAAEAALWISDSGGLQEEASVLKRPVVVVRRSTERPEVLGTFADLVAPGPELIEAAAARLADVTLADRLAAVPCPYGDGTASATIVERISTLVG